MAAPDWVLSSEETAAGMAAWAAARGLRYERIGLLPQASKNLRARPDLAARGWVISRPIEGGATDALYLKWGEAQNRPARFSENVCFGELAPGVMGTLAHHSSAREWEQRSSPGVGFAELISTTAAVVMLPEAGPLTRHLDAKPKPGRRKVIELPGKPYSELTRPVDLTPGFGERYRWSLWSQDDPGLLAPVFDGDVMQALDAAPERTGLTVEGGALVVEAFDYLDDAASLDGLVRLAGAFARALRAAAARLPRLEPGASLPPPADSAYRSWTREGAAGFEWPAPPPDLTTARTTYKGHIERTRGRGCHSEPAGAVLALLAIWALRRR